MKNKVDTLLKKNKVMLYQIVVGTDPGALYLKMTEFEPVASHRPSRRVDRQDYLGL
jgi:hypothetical protein